MATRIFINEVARVCKALSKVSTVAVLLAMEYGNKHSVTSIHEDTKLNRRSIRESLTVLERAGFIRRVPEDNNSRLRWFEVVDSGLSEVIRGLVMRN